MSLTVQWVDCLSGEKGTAERLPFEIGSGPGADLRLNGSGVAERHCAINLVRGQGVCIVRQEANFPLVVNGESVEFIPLLPDTDYAVKVGGHFLALRSGKKAEAWAKLFDCTRWTLRNAANSQVDGPMGFAELCKFAEEQKRDPRCVVQPATLGRGFLLSDAIEVWKEMEDARGRAAANSAEEVEETPELMTCPVCWLKFDLGDIMHIATHDSLRGDPVLGEDAPQRFLATRFNDLGQAIDALGLPCTETACPHCRRALPPGFTEMRHHIISIVGDQSAGKSYYLSVLLKMLPASLYQNFSVVFQDADPAGNAMINEMKQTLFGARSPEEARLVKTQLEGSMYVRLPRFGRTVALPKPFVFSAASTINREERCALIFYDNAGEHFQPGRDSADSPGAQHVASSSGVLFLFDPFNSPDFRKLIADGKDPQLEKPVVDQQAVILSEMKVRISRLLKVELLAQIDLPLAVIIGKCDGWIHLLEPEPLRQTVRNGCLDVEAITENSRRVRALVEKVCPAIVANAESISRNVLYFPVSSFGHAPVRLGAGDYVPDPRLLKPFEVETPVLWLLSLIEPKLAPGCSS